MELDKIQDVLSENLGEGYRIVRDNGELSPIIEWIDWVQQSDNDDDIRVEVNFDDETMETFEKGVELRQIWHEDAIGGIIQNNYDISEVQINETGIFGQILNTYHNKQISPLAIRLSKRFKLSISKDLWDLVALAYALYVVGDTDTAFQVLSLLDEAEFNNNYDLWAPIEYGVALQSAIYMTKNEGALAKNCIEKITLTRGRSALSTKVLARVLNGSLLKYEDIEKSKDKKSEYSNRMAHLYQLMFIRELGGGTEFSVDRADKEIQENIGKLKVLIEFFNER